MDYMGVIYGLQIEDVPENLRELVYFKNIAFNCQEILNLPTLYVGYCLAKSKFPDIKVSKNKITDSIYWIPSEDERKHSFIEGIHDFLVKLPDLYFSRYEFKPLDINSYYIINTITIDKVYLTSKLVLYVLSNSTIYSFDLNSLRYFNVDIEKNLSNLVDNKNKVFKDKKGEIYQKFNKMYETEFIERYIVTLI